MDGAWGRGERDEGRVEGAWERGERDEGRIAGVCPRELSSCVASSVVSAASGDEVGVACDWVASFCLGVRGLCMVRVEEKLGWRDRGMHRE